MSENFTLKKVFFSKVVETRFYTLLKKKLKKVEFFIYIKKEPQLAEIDRTPLNLFWFVRQSDVLNLKCSHVEKSEFVLILRCVYESS